MDAYAHSALERETDRVRSAGPGARATTAFRAAAALGQLVGGGDLDEGEVQSALIEAGMAAGLGHREVEQHVQRGLREGRKQPRTAPTRSGAAGPAKPPVKQPTVLVASDTATAVEDVKRPPVHEVVGLWDACSPVAEDPAVVSYLRERSLDPDAVDLWGLARALPVGARVPWWASHDRLPWSMTGHRLILPAYDHTGAMVTLRARCLAPADPRLKEIAPAGHHVRGTAFACSLATQVLHSGPPAWWQARQFLIVEGGPDFLTWATQQRDAEAEGPAVIGVYSGGWTSAIAARIPDGALVLIRTHGDETGENYARTVHTTLKGRCELRRAVAPELSDGA